MVALSQFLTFEILSGVKMELIVISTTWYVVLIIFDLASLKFSLTILEWRCCTHFSGMPKSRDFA